MPRLVLYLDIADERLNEINQHADSFNQVIEDGEVAITNSCVDTMLRNFIQHVFLVLMPLRGTTLSRKH